MTQEHTNWVIDSERSCGKDCVGVDGVRGAGNSLIGDIQVVSVVNMMKNFFHRSTEHLKSFFNMKYSIQN